MTKLLTAMSAIAFAVLFSNAIAQNTQSSDDKTQAQMATGERKIGRGEGTDWEGRRVPAEPENARTAPTGGDSLAMTCRGKTGRDKDQCLGQAQENAGVPAKEGGKQ